MSEERVKRKLSTIQSADVVGYSRLMGDDEEATVRTLEAYRKVMSDLIEQFRKRMVDSFIKRSYLSFKFNNAISRFLL